MGLFESPAARLEREANERAKELAETIDAINQMGETYGGMWRALAEQGYTPDEARALVVSNEVGRSAASVVEAVSALVAIGFAHIKNDPKGGSDGNA